ncbi:hypothetical protein [Treponema sp.]|uniref:hypothetical protein n=1 Tax=Treponema sp. TaxID=166 RepID=UPI00388FF4C3
MRKFIVFIFSIAFNASMMFGLGFGWSIIETNNPKMGECSVDVFEGTDLYDFACLVDKQDVNGIKNSYSKYEGLFDSLESKGTDNKHVHLKLMHWAVGNKKYEALETLLVLGMNPNVLVEYGDYKLSPLYFALFNSRNHGINETDKFISLLLKYKADPNIGRSPLWCFTSAESVKGDLGKLKLLVDNSDINLEQYGYLDKPLFMILIEKRSSSLDLAKYLLIDCSINIDCNYFDDDGLKKKNEMTNSIDRIKFLSKDKNYKFKKNKDFLLILERAKSCSN